MVFESSEECGATIKFGIVTESRPGFARVTLSDFDQLRTMWLPILYPKTLEDQAIWTYDKNEHVAVLLDQRGEDGVILGAIFSEADTPPVSDPHKFAVKFKDGAFIEYDRATHILKVTGVTKVIIEANTDIELHAGSKITLDAPTTEVSQALVVNGLLTYKKGMSGQGNFSQSGNISATGSIMDAGGNSNHHAH